MSQAAVPEYCEAAPTFLPPVSCTPGSCGNYQWLEGASISYGSDSREIGATASLTCLPGYFPAGSAFGLENPVQLRCGPVVQKENEAEVEWKLTYTGARAGLICAPNGMAVYDTVALLGSIQLTLNLPSTITPEHWGWGVPDTLCTEFKERFLSDLSLALVMALSSAGQVPLDANAMMAVDLAACARRLSLAEAPRQLQEALETSVSFTVKVANDAEALMLQFAVTDADASDVFKRVFALALVSSSGIEATGIVTSRMTRDILYLIDEPDGTQVSVATRENSHWYLHGDNNTNNETETNGTGEEDEDFLGSPAFIGLVAGGSCCCCCCCVVCCYLRRRYMVEIYIDSEESEEEEATSPIDGPTTKNPETSDPQSQRFKMLQIGEYPDLGPPAISNTAMCCLCASLCLMVLSTRRSAKQISVGLWGAEGRKAVVQFVLFFLNLSPVFFADSFGTPGNLF
eukprot:s12_g14.t1